MHVFFSETVLRRMFNFVFCQMVNILDKELLPVTKWIFCTVNNLSNQLRMLNVDYNSFRPS